MFKIIEKLFGKQVQQSKDKPVEQVQAAVSETKQWTQEEWIKLLFNSYKYSQGSPGLQEKIIKYVVLKEDLVVEARALQEIERTLKKTVSRHLEGGGEFTYNPKHAGMSLDYEWIEGDVESLQKKVLLAIESKKQMDEDRLVKEITEEMIGRDYYFLIGSKGRKGAGSGGENVDPWLSYVCEYGLNHKATGIESIDILFREITSRIKQMENLNRQAQGVQLSDTELKLIDVVKVYNPKHPGREVTLSLAA